MAVKRTIKRNKEATEKITIVEAFKEFYREKELSNLSESTLSNYKKTYRLFMCFFDFDKDTLLEVINKSLLFEWIGTLKIEGTKITSINGYLRNIKVFLRWCMDEERGYLAPFSFPVIKKQEEPLKLFSDEDIAKLLEKPKDYNNFVECRTYAIVNWILATGNRSATVCEIRIEDINFKNKEISLRHTKNKKAQIIPLSTTLEKVIKRYIKEWRNDEEGWLFPNIGDEKLDTSASRKAFAQYCKQRGVSKTNLHGLRHNFAKYWVQNNGNLFVLQQVLGHSTLEMTRRYVKLFSEDIKTDYEKFSALDTITRTTKRTKTIKRKI